MNRTIVLTGAASGIGWATAEELKAAGHRVIGVDLHDTDIIADLSSSEGRAAMARNVSRLAPEGIDGVVAAAGVSIKTSAGIAVAVNYFGAVATLELLRPLMLRSPAPCAVAILSSTMLLEHDGPLVEACRSGDEAAAIAVGEALRRSSSAYPSTKYALARWLRQAAISPEWAGSGILLNGVAPGVVNTGMTGPFLATEDGRSMLARITPTAFADRSYGEASELAEVIAFLATLRGRFMLGQILYVDGGTDAILRTDSI